MRIVPPIQTALQAMRHFMGLFPGTELDARIRRGARRSSKRVVALGQDTLKLSADGDSPEYFTLTRRQGFSGVEHALIEAILLRSPDFRLLQDDVYKEEKGNLLLIDIIAGILSPAMKSTLQRLLSAFCSLSQQTYEGNKIVYAVGLDQAGKGETDFFSFIRTDYAKVFSNSRNTILVIDPAGRLIRHEHLEYHPDKDERMRIPCPLHFLQLAHWTRENPGAVLAALIWSGDILIFRQGSLCFALRRGRWKHYPHAQSISLLSTTMAKHTENLRETLYATLLDISFQRSGGCLGFVRRGSEKAVTEEVIVASDAFLGPDTISEKARTLQHLIAGKRFQDIERSLRLELASMDGAFVFSANRVLTAGAILKIQSSDTQGGGRRAAAKALARYGLGVKISNDGQIDVFYNTRSAGEPEIEELAALG